MPSKDSIKVYLCIFFAILFSCALPVGSLFIKEGDTNDIDRGTYKNFPRSVRILTDTKLFFAELDSAIFDSVLGRNFLYKTFSCAFYIHFLNFDTRYTVRGQDGWLFLGNNYANVLDHHIQPVKPNPDYKTIIYGRVSKLAQAAKNTGAHFLCLICPDKHGIYFDCLPGYLTYNGHVQRMDKTVREISSDVTEKEHLLRVGVFAAHMKRVIPTMQAALNRLFREGPGSEAQHAPKSNAPRNAQKRRQKTVGVSMAIRR